MPYKDIEKARASARRSQQKSYYRKKQLLQKTKPCVCGCGKLVSPVTPEGRKINFCHGHRKLTPEESLYRRNVFARISADPEYQKRRLLGAYLRPNKPERRMIAIIQKYGLPFEYVGDGSLVIGKSNPDFISMDNKKIIEIFGDYWHTLMGRTLMSTEEGRVKRFKELGYDCLVIWESQMKHWTDEEIYKKVSEWHSILVTQ